MDGRITSGVNTDRSIPNRAKKDGYAIMESMKSRNKTHGLFLSSSLLVFLVLGVFLHSLAADESACVLGKTEMTHCPNETTGALHIVGDHLNFFLGVIQNENIEKFLLGALATTLFISGGLFVGYALSRALFRSEQYFLHGRWRDGLLSSLNTLFSWNAFSYSYSR